MTYMLSTLAGGKLVVALEVSLTLETRHFFPHGRRADTRSNHCPIAHWL
jgi:hypothetical protein